MIDDVSGMGVLVCSNELTKGAGNVGHFHFSNVALKCSPLAAWMLDNCRQVFVVLIWVHACTDQVFAILSIVFDSAFRLSFMMHWSSANFMLDDVAPL